MSVFRTAALRVALLAKPSFMKKVCPSIARTGQCRYLSAGATGTVAHDISGIFPPIPTPFNPDESIAWDKLEFNINLWNNIPLRGYVVLGSNGEYPYLTWDERVELVSKVFHITPSDKIIIAGSGCESTRDTILMTQKMADAGAELVLVVTPYYFKSRMTNSALIDHYTKVADSSPVPVILYSVPGNTGIDLAPEVTIKLSHHPNIIGIKESGGDIAKIGNIVYKTAKNGFQVLAGSASFLLPAYSIGCVGGVCALANVLGKEICDLEQLFKDGNMKEAMKLQQRLIEPNASITKRFSVSGLKTAMEWFGYYGGPLRSPMQPVTKEEETAIQHVFTENGFL